MINTAERFSRRKFIRRTALGAAGIILATSMVNNTYGVLSDTSAYSRVVVVKDENVLDSESFSDSSINQEIVQIMMDAGIKSLTGIDSLGEAWKSLFPGITQKTIIGIKVNAINWLIPTHPRVTNSVVNGLTSMIVDGKPFPENNIIIWDRNDAHLQKAGYKINKGENGVRCFGTNGNYTSEKFEIVKGRRPQGISKILAEQCDYLINLSVLKSHGLAGVTLSLKNHYGTCEFPMDLHEDFCDPAISILNAIPIIRNKQVVSICDAVFGSTIDADKPPTVKPKGLIFSKDPVALDATGASILGFLGATTTSLDGMARHIVTSSKPPYNLGEWDSKKFEYIMVENPSSKTGVKNGKNEGE